MSKYNTSHKCESCNLEFNGLIALMDHTLIYHDDAFGVDVSWKCKVCTKIFIYEDDMQSHIKTKHSNEQQLNATIELPNILYIHAVHVEKSSLIIFVMENTCRANM